MNPSKLKLFLLTVCGAVLMPLVSHAEISCTRGGLKEAVDLYIVAQTKGDLTGLALPKGVGYWENMAVADISKGFVTKPLKIDFHRSFYDTATCQSLTEVIVTDKAAPYVLVTRLRVNHNKIAEIETLWTTTGYWLFDADAYLKYSTTESWEPIPAEKRDSRGTLIAAATAYLDAFLEGKIDLVPWGFPCHRTEGGAHTGKGLPTDSCEDGVPAGVNIANRRFIVDEILGTVQVFCTFGAGTPNGGSGAADSHMFRVENGKLRYAHTLTHMLQSSFKGNNPPPPPATPAKK
jgi:hypothetical protein